MSIIDGFPATSFDKKDREWVKAVADDSAGDVLPDTTGASTGDVLTLNEDGEAEWKPPSGGGLVNEIFPYEARVTLIISGVTDGSWQLFCGCTEDSQLWMYADNEWFSDISNKIAVTNGTYSLGIISNYSPPFMKDIDPVNWNITLDDNATLTEESGYYWIDFSGDSTITAVYIGG